MPQLTLYLFGAPRIQIDGVHLPIRRRKAVALLAYLAVTQLPHSRDALATLFWPEYDQTTARDNLRRILSALHQSLKHRWLEIDHTTIRLSSAEDVWVDVNGFQRHLATYTSHRHMGEALCQICLSDLKRAAMLYTADFLHGFTLPDSPEFDEWQRYETERLRATLAMALARLGEEYRMQGDSVAAIEAVRRWVALDALYEPAQRQLMLLYAQAGQLAAALQQYQLCIQTLDKELGVLPAEETQALYAEIRRGQWSAPSTSLPQNFRVLGGHVTNLPIQTTPFVGRETELASLTKLLENDETRLITILGAGGMGKSRLALEAAKEQRAFQQEYVFFIALAALQSGEEMVTAIIDAVGYPLQQDGRLPIQQLLDYLYPKSMLLVLDNFEHLLDQAGLVNQILQSTPAIRILVSSQARLHLSGETLFALQGMSFPASGLEENALDYDAVKLFVQSARRQHATVDLNTDLLPHVVEICRLVEGMPLAILLAAAWSDLLSPKEIAAEIRQNLDFLTSELHDLPDRQRSVQAVFAYSWERLTVDERTVFMRLALFGGGFTRHAAQQVAGASLQTLSALVNKALLHRNEHGRYVIHGLLRQYAEAALDAAGEHTRIGDAHCFYYMDFLAQCETHLKDAGQVASLSEIEMDRENVRMAWMWAIAHKHRVQVAQALESLGSFYQMHSRFQEGEQLFAAATESFSPTESGTASHLLLRLLIWQAKFSRILGHREQAQRLLQRVLTLLDDHAPGNGDSRPLRAAVLHGLGQLAYATSEQIEARALFEQSLASYSDLGDLWGKANVLLDLQNIGRNRLDQGTSRQHQEQTEASKQMVLESLAIFRTFGDQVNIASALERLGVVYLTMGQAKAAQTALDECLEICQTLPLISPPFVAATGHLGIVQEYLGSYAQMYILGQEVLTFAQEIGDVNRMYVGYNLCGGAALVQKEYTEAQRWLEQGVSLNRCYDGKGLVFSLSGLGLANYELGYREEAQQQLVEAGTIALKTHTVRGSVHNLLLGALLLAAREQHVKAVEVYALAMCFPFVANSHWCADVAGTQLAAVFGSLSPSAVVMAQQQGQARDLWTSIAMLLAEFGHGKVHHLPH